MTKEALGELILSSERQLYATAKTILSDDQDCADAIQESIVKAFSKIDTLKKDRYAKTWLMRILINECYNIARRINVNEPLDEGYAENMKQNYMVVFNAITYPHLNPTMPIGGGFSLRPGTDMTVYLTYAIIAGNAPDIEELRKDPPQLQIAEYPIRKMLDIK